MKREHPTFAVLTAPGAARGDPLAAEADLVSRRTGVVRELRPVHKDIGEPVLPYVFGAELANHRFGEEERALRTCSGKGNTLADARRSTLGEAVERYSGACWDGGEIDHARRAELHGESLDPRELVLFAPEQYDNLPYAPYREQSVLGWVGGRSLVSDARVWLPAIGVLMYYATGTADEYLCPITSNGLAAGPTLLEAVLAAALEVLERDAYMIAWLHRLPCRRADPWTHPHAEVRDICEAYRRRGVEVGLWRLPSDHPAAIFLALAVQADGVGPAVVAGLGADLDPARAACKAVLEVGQVRPSMRQRMRDPEIAIKIEELVAAPRRVSEHTDHDLLYASPRMAGAFDFLLERPVEETAWTAGDLAPAAALTTLVEHFRASGGDLLYYDLTPPDMRQLRLHTARVVIPGFQPIHFGRRERRLGGARLYDLPVQLGITPQRASPDGLNSDPHPLA